MNIMTGNIMNSYELVKQLGSRFKKYRIYLNLTQVEISEKSGVSIRSIQNFENGEDIRLSNLIKLLKSINAVSNIELIIPDVEDRPSYIYSKNFDKKRVRKNTVTEDKPFTWGDEKND